MALGDTRGGDIGWKKWLLATWAVLECLLFSGVIFGWPSLVWVFKDKGVYADLCPETPATNTSLPITIQGGVTQSVTSTKSTDDDYKCDPQDARMTLCFTIASTVFGISTALFGYINYRFATRTTRILCYWIYVPGVLCLAFVTTETPWLMFPGLVLIGVGGLQVLVTNIQVTKLFRKGSSSLVGLLNGAFDTSAAVLLVVKLAYGSGVSPKYMFIGAVATYMFMMSVSTFIFLPTGFIEGPDKCIDGHVVSDTATTAVNDDVTPVKTDTPTLKACLKNPMYITHVIWMSLLQLRFHFFLGTVNTFLNRKLDDDDDRVSYFTDVLLYTMMGGFVAAVLVGLIHDWQKRYFARACQESKSYLNVMSAVLPQSITCGLAVFLSVLVLFTEPALLYVIFITMTLYRSFLYIMASAFIADLFPIPYFGFLYGVMGTCNGVVVLLQYAFFTWTEAYNGGPLHTDIFLLCLVLVSFVHPLHLWLRARRGKT